jgi:hypothetical protein
LRGSITSWGGHDGARVWQTRRRAAVVLLLSGLAFASFAASAGACRCAPRSLEQHFDQAEIVLIGTATAVRPASSPEGTRWLEVDFAPQFTAGKPIKGTLDGVVLVTSDTSASCGVAVEVGETYVVFASRAEPGDRLAWFHTCSGSRIYRGGPRAAEMEPFPGLPIERVVPRLLELAGAPASQPPAPRFHTDPACWTEPRTHQVGPPPRELRERVRISWRRLPEPPMDESARSPNGAYRLWVRNPPAGAETTSSAVAIVDVERDELLTIELDKVAAGIAPTWINEKLVFVRVWWGRSIGTDLVIDVEAGAVLYQEAIDAGTLAFEQYREACAGQCPCSPATARATTEETTPPSRPAPDEPALDLDTLTSSLAYLDGDWDGRVWSDAGGLTWVGSSLFGAGSAAARSEYPVEIREVRATPSGPWLLVDLFAVSRCHEPQAPVVHRGWIPAFSSRGRLVAGTYPGGC